ncbi:MYXO-CTERM sorting domain-containing protein [Nannocystis pusilla]|uniref:MYXO-CTERM sorting domain-containing protein n=1 Tax=Nannocystis pusilla TaxID=889268 RepID=UPI003B80A4CF
MAPTWRRSSATTRSIRQRRWRPSAPARRTPARSRRTGGTGIRRNARRGPQGGDDERHQRRPDRGADERRAGQRRLGGSEGSEGSEGSASGGQGELVDHGCACDSTTPSPLGALMLVGLGLLRPRRRRRALG